MSAYTKGPWKAVKIDDGIYEVRCSNPDKLPVVVIDRHRDGHAPTRELTTPADAHLIAAAPALLNGINGLIGLIQLVCSRDDMPPAIKAALESSWRFDEAKLAAYQAEGK
jgi:hypothetical protein